MRALNIRWLGNLPYAEALTLQKGLHNSVSHGNNEEDYLLLLDTIMSLLSDGQGDKDNLIANKEKLDNLGIEYFETDRGGDITFHGKGQLIGYPIIRLSDPKKVIPFVRTIEKSIINALAAFNIDSYSKEEDTGVWTSKGKIASIGIKVSKWTTYHGFSLNIFEDLNGFDLINPCGNSDEKIASVHSFNRSFFKEIVDEVSQFQSFNYETLIVNYLNLHQLNLRKKNMKQMKWWTEEFLIKIKNVIPVTIKLLPGEPKRPEWMKVKANLGSEYIE